MQKVYEKLVTCLKRYAKTWKFGGAVNNIGNKLKMKLVPLANVALNFVSACSISRFQPADVKTAKVQLQFLWPR